MKIFFLSLVLAGKTCSLFAQSSDSLTLLNEANSKLKNGTSVSSILTDKKYLPIHPATAFRDEVKENCNTDILKITTTEEPGKKIKVLASVTDKEGKAIANALVYLYQTDSKGWYAADAPHVLSYGGDVRHARLFGYVRANAKGQFELHTVKPSGYPNSDLPAHIHVHVWADGYNNFVNEFLFDDDDRLKGKIREQSVRNQFIISKPEKTVAPFDQQFSYKIILEK